MQLLSTSDTRRELGRDASTIARMVRDGRIKPATKLPGLRGAYLFTADEVARVKAELAEPPAGPEKGDAA